MSSKAEKFCSSEKCGESFFSSSVRYVIGCLWACIYYALKRSGVAPPCWGVSPMQNPPILRDGLENADLFPMSGPASWCFLIPKRYCTQGTELNWTGLSLRSCDVESLTAANIKLKNMCVHGLRLCWSNSAITYWWGPDWVYTCTPTSIYTFPLRIF